MKKLVFLMIPWLMIFSNEVIGQETEFAQSSDGVNIAYQYFGQGELPLVFVHGWSCDKSYWKEQTGLLKDRYKIVAIDLAGHGESAPGRKSYTIPAFAQDVMAIIQKLKLTKFILIGHSMGVNVILETAFKMPEKTLAIFSIDGYREIPEVLTTEELSALDKKNRKWWADKEFQPFVYNWVKSWPHLDSESAAINKIAMDMSQNDPYAATESMLNMLQWYYSDYPSALKKIPGIPVISIGSESKPDVNIFRHHGVNFQDFRMDGLSHFLHITHPKEFNEIFFRQLELIGTGK
jgi:pimeloyl-ACP methyl ester carboxylesterase